MNGKQAATLTAVLWLFGALLGIGFGTAHAHADTPPAPPAVCMEDMDCWDCATMGNHICGPNNSTGLLPGVYSEDGVWLYDFTG